MSKQYNLKTGTIQHAFNKSRAKIQVFGGSFGNGKSTGLIIKALQLVVDYPGCLGLMGRATYPKLNDTLRKDFFEWCPAAWVKKRPTQDDNSVTFTNGSVINFRYIQQRGKTTADQQTTSNLLSATYDWIIVDQVEDPEIGYKDFLDLLGRLRRETPYHPDGPEDQSMPTTGPRWLMLGANPSRNWFYKEVIGPYIMWRDKGIYSEKLLVDVETQQPIIELHESDIYANKDNLAPDYIKTMEATYKGQMRKRFLEGKWAAFEGLVYPQFDPMRNLISRAAAMEYLDTCLERHVQVTVIEGYDFGLTSPSCYLFGFVDDFGRVIILDGYYRPDFNYEDQPAAIYEIRQKYAGMLRSEDPIEADPSIFRKTVVAKRQTGDTVAKLLSGFNLSLRAGSNDIQAGITKVGAYLSGRRGIPHIITGDDPGPLLYIVDDLTFFSDEIGSYYWKKNPFGVAIDEPAGDTDHAMDAVKYLLSRRPEVAKIVVPRDKLPPKWMFWHEMEQSAYVDATRGK